MFWDSSALVPLLLAESRTGRMLELLRADREPAVWWASPVECRSALERSRGEGRLSADQLAEASSRLERLAGGVDVVAPTAPVRDRALRALAAHPLRTADALQLAAALVWSGDGGGEPFVCLDDRLRDAARREGFEVLPAAGT